MHRKLETKVSRLIANYDNGNRADAKSALKRLTRVELANLLIEGHQVPEWPQDPIWEYDFRRWVLLALEGYE